MPERYHHLFDQNRAWASRRLAEDPGFFERLAKGQAPDFLFIGCADSRVSAQELTGTHLGEMFVHRNVANLVLYEDLNAMAVLQYAVEVLEVDHVIVCGHYGCGGVKAAVDGLSHGLLDHWLRNITDVAHHHWDELEPLDDEARHRRLVELNVLEQVRRIRSLPMIRQAAEGRFLQVHGMVYGLDSGLLFDLDDAARASEAEYPDL